MRVPPRIGGSVPPSMLVSPRAEGIPSRSVGYSVYPFLARRFAARGLFSPSLSAVPAGDPIYGPCSVPAAMRMGASAAVAGSLPLTPVDAVDLRGADSACGAVTRRKRDGRGRQRDEEDLPECPQRGSAAPPRHGLPWRRFRRAVRSPGACPAASPTKAPPAS